LPQSKNRSSSRFAIFAQERILVLAVILVGCAQFSIMLGFVVIMPLGPDIARDLGFGPARIGLAASLYALAGFLGGLAVSPRLDRFARRPAWCLCMAGTALGILAAAYAGSLWQLLGARMLAGACGGPATATGLAIIADLARPEQKPGAIGQVMAVTPLVSILGMPASLALAAVAGWRAPLVLVALFALVVAAAGHRWLPRLDGHLAAGHGPMGFSLRAAATNPRYVRMLAGVAAAAFSFNLLTATNPAILLLNLHFPRGWLSLFYLGAGLTALTALHAARLHSKRHGMANPMLIGSTLFLLGATGFYLFEISLPGGALALAVMLVGVSMVNMATWATAIQVPGPREQAGFGATASALQNLAGALGAGLSSVILIDLPGHRLGHTAALGGVAMISLLALLALSLREAGQQRRVDLYRE